MEPVRRAELVFFPLDEELDLLPGSLTPQQHEHLVHLAVWMPFRRAVQMLERLLGVQVSEATVRRLTEEAGAHIQAMQTQESRPPEAEEPSRLGPAKQAISSDGAYVPLTTGEWAEVRTVAIGTVEPCKPAEQEAAVKVTALSYFSSMSDAETFVQLAEGEMRRRKVRDAVAVCALTDGASWLQGFIDLHRPDAVRILDFAHAAQYVSAIGQAVGSQGKWLPKKWFEGVLHRLKHEGPERVLGHLKRLAERCHDPEVDKKWRYLFVRRHLLLYPRYQQAGWPIGSGMVESAHKVVWQSRLKGPGMRWAPIHVNALLALRTSVCNDRWDEAWQQGLEHQRRFRLHVRQRHARPRLHALVTSWLLLMLRLRPPAPRPLRPALVPVPEPPATLPGSCRPSAHHPWKRGPACRPKVIAKK